jgi:hypothetical protein
METSQKVSLVEPGRRSHRRLGSLQKGELQMPISFANIPANIKIKL